MASKSQPAGHTLTVQPATADWRQRHFSCRARACLRLATAALAQVRHAFGPRTRAAALLGVLPLVAFGGDGASGALPRQMLKVTKHREGNVIRVFVENLEAAEVTATFELGPVNLKGSAEFPFTATFPPHQTIEAFSLSPIRGDREWSYTLTNHYTLGSNRAVHDDACVYRLPYAPGRAFRVSQGFDGAFSHTGPERYAIDWQMPEGTPVLAARGGVVIATKDDSQTGGAQRRFEDCANYVLIQHPDGTIGNYAHLQVHGARVHAGQTVAAGTLIGLSGNTGFTSGAHLHFSVFKARNGRERESLPVKFRTEDGTPATLLCDRVYLAPNTLHAAAGSQARRAVN
jgi:murein DD-endopeptidase MepM/ murein hydrolase activator NlpD